MSSNVILVCGILTLSRFDNCSGVSIIDFEQLNIRYLVSLLKLISLGSNIIRKFAYNISPHRKV